MVVVHHGNDPEILARRCAASLSRPDPLRPIDLVIPGNAMAKWLALRIAHHSGIAAHLRFRAPRDVIVEYCLAAGGGEGQEPRLADWLSPEPLGWRLLASIVQRGASGLPRFLATYLARSGDPAGEVRLAQRLAEQFAEYLLYRSDVLARWEGGDVEAGGWQAEFWRQVTDGAGFAPATALQKSLTDAPERKLADNLPDALWVFGLPAAPPILFDVLGRMAALGTTIDFFVLSPSAAYWADLMTPRQVAESGLDEAAGRIAMGHPLLASLGRQGREFHGLWVERFLSEGRDRDCYSEPAENTVLATLKRELLTLEPDPDPARPAGDGRSLQIHACPGALREVQVAHDLLLARFEEEPQLRPEQVAILVPDLAAYAPLLETEFGAHGEIPYSLTRRAEGTDSAAQEVFLDILELARGRLAASQMMGVLSSRPLRDRFGFSADDEAVFHHWLEAAAIRWGADARMRRQLGLGEADTFTWRQGLDRLLLGYAAGADSDPGSALGTTLGVAGIEGSEAQLAGHWIGVAERLIRLCGEARESRPVSAWQAILRGLLDDLFTLEDSLVLRRAVDGLGEMAELSGLGGDISLAGLIQLLRPRLLRPGVPATFLAGGVTIADARMMRGIPFEVICVLGLDSERFPQQDRRAAHDLLRADPRPGDLSRRLDDRWLFLECLLCARRSLILTYSGLDPASGARRPPAMVLEELLGWLRGRWPSADHQGWVTRHPLNARSPAYFSSDPAQDGALFSFREARADQARVRLAGGFSRHRLIAEDEPLPEETITEISLGSLQGFFRNPARALLNRIGIYQQAERWVEDDEPFALGALEQYRLRSAALDALVQGLPAEQLSERLRYRGLLPDGEAGREQGRDLVNQVLSQWRTVDRGPDSRGRLFELELDGITLKGHLDGIGPAGMLWLHTGKYRGAHVLDWWLCHLCWNATLPADGNGRSRCHFADGQVVDLRPVRQAAETLAELLTIYLAGRRRLYRFDAESAWKGVYDHLAAGKSESDSLDAAGNAWLKRQGDHPDWYWRQLLPDGDLIDEDYLHRALRVLKPLRESLDD